jgi:DNA-binding MarR family transcriptional regulator
MLSGQADIASGCARDPSPSGRSDNGPGMDEDLQLLGEDLITTAAQLVRWAPADGWAISLASARILARLSDNGPSRISDLAELEHCTQPAITNHVKRLEAANLVRRRTDPTDARAWVIELTEAGVGQLNGIRHSSGTDLEPSLASLTRRDHKVLRNCIEAMRRVMSQPTRDPLQRLPE